MVNAISRVGFSAQTHWQDLDLNKKYDPSTISSVNYSTSTGADGEQIPAASISDQYGAPKQEKHTIRNILLGIAGLIGLGYGVSKFGLSKIDKADSLFKKTGDNIVKWTEAPFKKVAGWFKK